MTDEEAAALHQRVAKLETVIAEIALSHSELSSLVAQLVRRAIWPDHGEDIYPAAQMVADADKIADRAVGEIARQRGMQP